MTAEKSHRFALTGQDPEGRNRTIILWQEAELVDGRVVRRVVVTLDATMTTATVFTRDEAVEVAQALLAASLTLSERSQRLCVSCLAAGGAP